MDYKFLEESAPLRREAESVLQGEKLLRNERESEN